MQRAQRLQRGPELQPLPPLTLSCPTAARRPHIPPGSSSFKNTGQMAETSVPRTSSLATPSGESPWGVLPGPSRHGCRGRGHGAGPAAAGEGTAPRCGADTQSRAGTDVRALPSALLHTAASPATQEHTARSPARCGHGQAHASSCRHRRTGDPDTQGRDTLRAVVREAVAQDPTQMPTPLRSHPRPTPAGRCGS